MGAVYYWKKRIGPFEMSWGRRGFKVKLVFRLWGK